jgi:aminomethyltransferase
MIANRGDHLFLVVNAACKDADIAHMKSHLSDSCDIDVITDRALIALQGPASQAALETLCPAVSDMRFMDVLTSEILGHDAWISRSGYTGEDGYEISVPNDIVVELVTKLVAMKSVEPIGLGARDSLRLEGGLCLYGHDIDTTTTPVQAGLPWAIQKSRRLGGERAGGFPGADIILAEFENGAARKRVGLRPDGRAPMREGTQLFATDTGGEPIGSITSGGFGPTVGHPVSMGYVTTEYRAINTTIYAEIRGKRMAAHVSALPFTPANFKR